MIDNLLEDSTTCSDVSLFQYPVAQVDDLICMGSLQAAAVASGRTCSLSLLSLLS
jgi:hypothetical protein